MVHIHQLVQDQINILGSHPNVLTLTYEELTENNKDIKILNSSLCNKICNFLGVEVKDMYSTTMKVNNVIKTNVR